MPYSMPDNIPDYIKNLPEGAQRIFVDAFNEAIDRGDSEEDARMAGWGAVKNVYEKSGDEWTKKAKNMTMRYVSMLGEVSPGDGDSGTKLSVVQVFRTGTFRHPLYGKFTITNDTLRTMVANFKENRPKAPTEMVVDYEHMSAVGPPTVSPAAGWVKKLEARDGELLATVEWTDKAAGLIRAKEYRFISPEWNMNYKDKESGKDIGPCLLSMALTNRPFIEGMQPVMLSDRLEKANAAVLMLSETVLERMLHSDDSMEDTSGAIRQAYYLQFPDKPDEPRYEYIADIYDTFVVVEKGGELFKLGYSRDDETGKVIFDADRVKVTKTVEYMPTGGDKMEAKDWDTEYINDLPDKAFAYIAPGGEKDEKGKTVPRDNRHLPYRNMDGSVNLDHLRNALARLDQTSLSQEAKAEARKALEKAAQEAGVGETEDAEDKSNKGQEGTVEEKLRELLGLGPDDDIVAAVTELKAKADKAGEAEQQKTEAEQAKEAAETRLTVAEVDADVDQALKDGHILPKQVDWAKNLRAKDSEGFKAFLASAPKIGPDGTVHGRESGEDAIQLTEAEITVGARLGVSREELVEQKKRDAAAKAKA